MAQPLMAGAALRDAWEAAATRQAIVVISCGGRKAAQPSIAADLYTGTYFRACLRAAQVIAPDARISILSARYGLLGLADGPVEPYELRLGQPGSVTAAVIRRQAAGRGLSGRPVIALCGARYAALAGQVWAEVATPLAGLGIGQQLHVLSTVRAGTAVAPTAGEAPVTSSGLCLPALEVTQAPGVAIYLLAVDGKQLSQFTTVARVRRDGGARLLGYQRPWVMQHIEQIRRYLDSPGALLPNALTIAFDDRVSFEPAPLASPVSYARYGQLHIPACEGLAEHDRPGWLVNGQQRAAAIERAARASLPVAVAGFIDADSARQREQFIRVNATKPLPSGLLYELLPLTVGPLPPALERRRLPALLVERLNHDPASPLYQMIRTVTCADGLIRDNSMLRALAGSISDGALAPYRVPAGQEPDIGGMTEVISHFWAAVRDVFRPAWGLPPRRSRLMHGAGVLSLGFLMDAIASGREQPPPATAVFAAGLRLVEPHCRWTGGRWEFGRGWNEIQNTGQDARLVSDFLTRRYKALARVSHTH